MVVSHAHKHDTHLFATLAEDLKAPLVRIAYQAEVAALTHGHAKNIQHSARHAIQIIDAYLLGAQPSVTQTALLLEPVHPSSVLTDAASELKDFAKTFSCVVHIESSHVHSFALSHRMALVGALTSIGKVCIEAQSLQEDIERRITLATYKTKKGMAVGIFLHSSSDVLHQQLLMRARNQIGKAARPFVGLTSGASAQLFVAEQLLQSVQSSLRTARRGNMSGFAFDLVPTAQLTLV